MLVIYGILQKKKKKKKAECNFVISFNAMNLLQNPGWLIRESRMKAYSAIFVLPSRSRSRSSDSSYSSYSSSKKHKKSKKKRKKRSRSRSGSWDRYYSPYRRSVSPRRRRSRSVLLLYFKSTGRNNLYS